MLHCMEIIRAFSRVLDLNIRAKTVKILEENMGDVLHDLGINKDFLGILHFYTK